MKAALEQIVDKRIAGVVYATSPEEPHVRLFLAFHDGTCFELYGENFTCCGGLGDVRGIPRSVESAGGAIRAVYGEPEYPTPRPENALSTGRDGPPIEYLRTFPRPLNTPSKREHRAWAAAARAIRRVKEP